MIKKLYKLLINMEDKMKYFLSIMIMICFFIINAEPGVWILDDGNPNNNRNDDHHEISTPHFVIAVQWS